MGEAQHDPSPYHLELLREHLAGRQVIVALDVLVACAAAAPRLHDLGVEEVLLVGGSRGTGEVAPEVERDAVLLGTGGADLMGAIRAFEAALDDPAEELRDAIDRFDPAGDALVVTTMFSGRRTLCGRPVFGAREPRWAALEDKTTVDALWDACGVVRAPSVIVPAELDALVAAAAPLDRGLGTVWVADNREGWHGGAAGLRWVRDDGDAEGAAADLASIADLVRVMPFLDGRPCSIHGWVLGDQVIVTRPCETVMWREVGASRLWYGGAHATAWRPSDADTEEMRQLTRAVGRHLRDTMGYRGVFTVDGILTADGFRPTELNPRFGAAIGALGRPTGLPLYLLNCLSVDRPDLDWRADELERTILAADGAAGAHLMLDGLDLPPRTARVLRDGQGWRVLDVDRDGGGEGDDAEATDPGDVPGAGPGEDGPVAEVELGPGATGSFLRITLPQHPDGEAVAPAVADLLPAVIAHLGVEVPALEAAPDRRPA